MMKKLYQSSFFLICSITLLVLGLTNVQAAPVNDDIANATTITGAIGTTGGNNFDATSETDEPDYITPTTNKVPDKTVWFKWTAPAPGNYTFNTFGTSFDTILAAYKFTGTGPGVLFTDLTWENDNDDYIDNTLVRLQSRLSFTATAGVTYYIVVDGQFATSGYIALNWGPTTSIPSNDDFTLPLPASAQLLPYDTGTIINATNINATPQVGEPNHLTAPLATAYSSVWFEWTAPSAGQVVIDTFGSSFNTIMAVYTGIGPGTTITNLTKVAENDDAGGGQQSRIYLTVPAPTTYYIAVDGFDYLGVFEGLQGNISLNWRIFTESPTNDNFASATTITGKTGTANAFNFFASPELPDEPYHYDIGGPYKSIWFKWVAPFSGKVIFNTFGSDFDTTMAAYTNYDGANLTSLTKLNESDDAGTGFQSKVTFPVAIGQVYYIAVDGSDYSGEPAEGYVTLNWKKVFPWVLFTPATTGMGN